MCILHTYHGPDCSPTGFASYCIVLKPLELEHHPTSFAISVSQLSICVMRGGLAYSTDPGGACVLLARSSVALDELPYPLCASGFLLCE